MKKLRRNPFDVPSNYGEVNTDGDAFVLDHNIESGTYVVVINDYDDEECFSTVITIKDELWGHGHITYLNGAIVMLEAGANDNKIDISVVSEVGYTVFEEGTTVELYKIDNI